MNKESSKTNNIKIDKKIIDMLTPSAVHMMYCTLNWEKILLGNKQPFLTVKQLDNLWADYFDSYEINDKTEDYNKRLMSLHFQLTNLASKIYSMKMFLKDEIGENNIANYGIKLAEMGLEQEPFSEKIFVNFRKKLLINLKKLNNYTIKFL